MEQSSGAVNQQASQEELVRLATLYDCEGSFCLSITDRPNRNNTKERVVVLDIGMTDEPTIQWVSDYLKLLGISHIHAQHPAQERRGAMFRVRVQTLRTLDKLLVLLEPHFRTKTDEAKIVHEYVRFALEHIRLHGHGSGKSEQLALERHEKFLSCRDRLRAVRLARLRDYTRYSFTQVKV